MALVAPFADAAPPLDATPAHAAWAAARPVAIDRLWSGAAAPDVLATTARALWTREHLWFAFDCAFTEIDADPPPVDTTRARYALWERDVCEAFVWSPAEPSDASYKEFEVAPTAQWYDVAVRRPRVDVDHDWRSGMAAAATVDVAAGSWRATMRLPFAAFGAVPARGERWRVNLFRITRLRGERQFLTLSPTGTPAPDFHVPAAFVPLIFA